MCAKAFEQRLGLQEGELLQLVRLLSQLGWERFEQELYQEAKYHLLCMYEQRQQPQQHQHSMQSPTRPGSAVCAGAFEFVSPPAATTASPPPGQRWTPPVKASARPVVPGQAATPLCVSRPLS
mgnify:CR=1 FL=1